VGVKRAIRGLFAGLVVFAMAAPVAQASLSVPSTTFTSAAAFEAAARGADNGTTPGEQGSGFRRWTPVGIAVNGSDPGSTPIPGGHTAALSPSRLQPWGIELDRDVAVANDGFESVNANAGFSPPDLWAPFNSHTTEFQIVAPTAQTGAPTPAVTRGLGVTFVNAQNAGATIEYFSGNTSLGQFSPPGGASFAGVLFRDPVVTRVLITLGTQAIFGFDGSSLAPGTSPTNTLAAAEDVVVAEPGAGAPTVRATAGVPVSPLLDSFDSSEPAADIRATVDWGDGNQSSGSIVPATGGGFTVAADHAYAVPGSFTATVTVQDFDGSELRTQVPVQVAPRATLTSVVCSPSSVAVTATATCLATVSDVDAGSASAPTGLVTFSTATAGAVFPGSGSCLLGPAATPGSSLCVVQFEPGQLPPAQARATAAYVGDAAHAGSGATASVAVRPQRCTLKALSRRLRPRGLGVLVTCDARSGVQITVQARVARKGRLRAFRLQFGVLRTSVTAGRPTVLVVKPAAGALPALRAALHRHQHISLKLTLTASSHSTTRTTTTRASALRLS
jgi:hypothetical protein